MTPEWINAISTCVYAAFTIIYVVATIFIVKSNKRIADATQKQVTELRRQFQEQNRPYVLVGFSEVRSGLLCLSIENAGNAPARSVRVSVNDDFIDNITDIRVQQRLRALTQALVYLAAKQRLYCNLGGPFDFKRLQEKPLVVDVAYSWDRQDYSERVEIDVGAYGWALSYESALGDISTHVKNISETLEGMKEKLR